MRFSTIILSSLPLAMVAAHGKIAVVSGDAGGNGTGLGIKGAVVPGAGKNSVTEVDTTVFGSTKIATNGLGRTEAGGQNKASDVTDTMAQSGSTLPQVSADGNGSISGTYHIVTTDGAGPVKAMIDSTASGKFSDGTQADVTTDVPGKNGNIKSNGQVPRGIEHFYLRARNLVKRAANVNKDYAVKVAVPANTTCTGTVAGQTNVCFMKIANSNPAGPFGGVIAFQMAGAGNTTSSTSTTTTTTQADTASTKKSSDKKAKANARSFVA